jgi:hypothetical protein
MDPLYGWPLTGPKALLPDDTAVSEDLKQELLDRSRFWHEHAGHGGCFRSEAAEAAYDQGRLCGHAAVDDAVRKLAHTEVVVAGVLPQHREHRRHVPVSRLRQHPLACSKDHAAGQGELELLVDRLLVGGGGGPALDEGDARHVAVPCASRRSAGAKDPGLAANRPKAPSTVSRSRSCSRS